MLMAAAGALPATCAAARLLSSSADRSSGLNGMALREKQMQYASHVKLHRG